MFPYLAFRLPEVKFLRRWLVVETKHTPTFGPVSETQKEGSFEEDWTGVGTEADRWGNRDGSLGRGRSSDAYPRPSCPGLAPSEGQALEQEAIALDLALPEDGMDPMKPFYLVLHGLNGGSSEVRDDG